MALLSVGNGPPVGCIHWNAYTSNDTDFLSWFQGNTTLQKVFTDFGHRKPLYWDNNRQYGPGINTQAIVDAELQAARAGRIDWFQYDYYPNVTAFSGDPSNIPPQAYINTYLDCHRTSPYKSLVKMGLMLTPLWLSYNTMPVVLPGDYGRMPQYISEIATIVADPDYMQIQGRPILGIYGYASMTGAQRTAWLAQLPSLLAALPPVWLIIQDHSATGAADMLASGARWMTNYGPNPTLPAGSTHYSFMGQQYPADITSFTSSGGGIANSASLTPTQDRRPTTTSPTAYVDQPSMPEFQSEIGAAYTFRQTGTGSIELILYYSWSENTEGGPGILPTFQEGTRYLAANSWSKTGNWPAAYHYCLDAAQLNFTKVGSWVGPQPTMTGSPNLTFSAAGSTITRSAGSWIADGFSVGDLLVTTGATGANNLAYAPVTAVTSSVLSVSASLTNQGPIGGCAAYLTSVVGAFNNDEMRSVTTNDTIDFSHERSLYLGIVAMTGPDRGIMAVSLNGVFQANVNLYSPTRQMQQVVWRSTRLSGGTNTIQGKVTGTKNASSSSVLVGFDAADIWYAP